jgi:glycogen debranching enzyme
MKHMGSRNHQLWDDEDGFFYDALVYPDGQYRTFRVRSLVGLIPLFAVERLEYDWVRQFPDFAAHLDWFLLNRPDLVREVVHEAPGTHVLTIVNSDQLARMVKRLWDETEFLSPYGIRSLSKVHEHEPFVIDGMSIGYEPAEALSKIKGGNSNWRGPVWFPAGFLVIESLRKLGKAWGPTFAIPTPASGGKPITFPEMARQLADRMIRLFTRDASSGHRPVFGGARRFQEDAHWRDLTLFYEYFHGDNGAGLGASHQTGWTALVASLIDEWRQ